MRARCGLESSGERFVCVTRSVSKIPDVKYIFGATFMQKVVVEVSVRTRLDTGRWESKRPHGCLLSKISMIRRNSGWAKFPYAFERETVWRWFVWRNIRYETSARLSAKIHLEAEAVAVGDGWSDV